MALISKNKLGFLEGIIPVPATTDPFYVAWQCNNTLIMSWLLNSISQSVIYLDCAIDIWNDLKECFSHGDLLHTDALQEEVYGLKQGIQTMIEYFTKLKTLCDELDHFLPFVPCSCFTKSYHQHDFIIRFLKGLGDKFSIVRS